MVDVIAWALAHRALVGATALLLAFWGLVELTYRVLCWAFVPSFRRRK